MSATPPNPHSLGRRLLEALAATEDVDENLDENLRDTFVARARVAGMSRLEAYRVLVNEIEVIEGALDDLWFSMTDEERAKLDKGGQITRERTHRLLTSAGFDVQTVEAASEKLGESIKNAESSAEMIAAIDRWRKEISPRNQEPESK